MKKNKRLENDELRPEYKRADFKGPFVRGKYAKKLRESSNIVVLRPEVAEAFPTEDSVNEALLSLMEIAERSARAKAKTEK